MNWILRYILPVLIGIYIISPIDAHPLFFDDLIAGIILLYLIYKGTRQGYRSPYGQETSGGQRTQEGVRSQGPLTLDEAYRILGVGPDATLEEITRAYKEKIQKTHPDKVSHMSEELQEKAKELTMRLNEAYAFLKKYGSSPD